MPRPKIKLNPQTKPRQALFNINFYLHHLSNQSIKATFSLPYPKLRTKAGQPRFNMPPPKACFRSKKATATSRIIRAIFFEVMKRHESPST